MAAARVQALVVHALGQTPVLEEVDVSDPGPGEVRIRIAAAGVCHTERRFPCLIPWLRCP